MVMEEESARRWRKSTPTIKRLNRTDMLNVLNQHRGELK